jgi:hypothetical protein
LFLLVALLMGGLTGLRHAIERRSPAGLVRRVTPLVTVAGTLVSALLLYAGTLWRAHDARTRTAATTAAAEAPAPAPTSEEAARLAALPATPPPLPPSSPSSTAPPAPARATSDELALAVAKGVNGLLPLAERYPHDPEVLRPLVIAFASRSTGLADAMVVTTRLFDAAPERTADDELQFLVKKAAGSPGEASKLAFAALTDHMGTTGPDLLYELMLSDQKAGKRAKELLATPAVRAKAAPPLLVAYDLRMAAGCGAKTPFLARAAELGDERTLQVLAPLSTGAKKGCGKRKRDACPPPCPEEAKQFQQTIARIVERGVATRR